MNNLEENLKLLLGLIRRVKDTCDDIEPTEVLVEQTRILVEYGGPSVILVSLDVSRNWSTTGDQMHLSFLGGNTYRSIFTNSLLEASSFTHNALQTLGEIE